MKTPPPRTGDRTGDELEPRRPQGGGERVSAGGAAPGESFGTWLRRQRVGREIDLREIADSTRISLRYLQALEEDRFDILPAAVFAKGFLRQYAKFVGLDPEEVVNFFEAARHADETQVPVEPARGRRRRRAPSSWTYAVAFGVVAAGLVALVAWLSALDQRRREEQTSPAPGGTEVAEVAEASPAAVAMPGGAAPAEATGEPALEPAAPSPPPAEPAAPAAAPPRSSGLEVTLDFSDRCWVEAWADGRRQLSELRVQGESLKVEAAREVVIKVGDIRVVDIEVNGHPVDEPEGTGVVRWLRFRQDALEGVRPGDPVEALPVEEASPRGDAASPAPADVAVGRRGARR